MMSKNRDAAGAGSCRSAARSVWVCHLVAGTWWRWCLFSINCRHVNTWQVCVFIMPILASCVNCSRHREMTKWFAHQIQQPKAMEYCMDCLFGALVIDDIHWWKVQGTLCNTTNWSRRAGASSLWKSCMNPFLFCWNIQEFFSQLNGIIKCRFSWITIACRSSHQISCLWRCWSCFQRGWVSGRA